MKGTGNAKTLDDVGKAAGRWLTENSVMLLFVVICVVGMFFAAQPAGYLSGEIATRLFRNLILILSLIVPVWAGMGLNFSIVLGAMAAQAGLLFIINFNLLGLLGLLISFLISVPLAVGLGILTGKLFNRTKGQEMITGMILGFFAKGVYELIFMYLCGPVIPIKNTSILLPSKVGINGIITLDGSLSGAIDKIWKLPLDKVIWMTLAGYIAFLAAKQAAMLMRKKGLSKKLTTAALADVAIMVGFFLAVKQIRSLEVMLSFTRIPMVTGLLVAGICGFLVFLGRTKLGADIKAVGQSIPIARAAGIRVERVRIIAVVISTVIAALGQMIYLQNLGTFTTYSAHEQIGTFSIAALLVGGASIKKAGISHAILGGILFHIMFIVAPLAGKNIFNDAQIGEYFRVFASYAVIAIALALHAWKTIVMEKKRAGEK